jgi:tetratricopeptide (TPR) repeat protein
MILTKIAFGVLFLALGWVYFFKPNIVLMINKAAREVFFNDRILLLERKKLAIFFFCLSFVALYMGVTALTDMLGKSGRNSWLMEASSYMMYMAEQDYCRERYDNAIQKYEQVLRTDPGNKTALRRLAYTYEAAGDSAKARVIWQRMLKLDPKNNEILEKLKLKKHDNKR